MDNTNTLRQQRYAAKKQSEGKKKYGFWLTERESEFVKAIAKDDVKTSFGKNIKDMLVDIAESYNCSPAEVLEMAVARMYLSENGLNQDYDYPSEEARAAMEYVDDGSPVISSKSVADLL